MNTREYNIFILFIIVSLFYSCSNTNDTSLHVLNKGYISTENIQNEIKFEIEENKKALLNYSAKKSKDIEGLKIEVSYVSPAMKFHQEYGELDSTNLEAFKEYSKKEFYTFKLKYKQERDPLKSKDLSMDYSSAIHYLTESIRNDLGIEIDKGKIINPDLVVFERTFGVKPFVMINLVFNKNKLSGAKRFVYFDKLFNKGFIKIDFSSIEEGII